MMPRAGLALLIFAPSCSFSFHAPLSPTRKHVSFLSIRATASDGDAREKESAKAEQSDTSLEDEWRALQASRKARTDDQTELYLKRYSDAGIALPDTTGGKLQLELPQGMSAEKIEPEAETKPSLPAALGRALGSIRVDAFLLAVAICISAWFALSAPTSAAEASPGAFDVDDYSAKVEYSWMASCDPRGTAPANAEASGADDEAAAGEDAVDEAVAASTKPRAAPKGPWIVFGR